MHKYLHPSIEATLGRLCFLCPCVFLLWTIQNKSWFNITVAFYSVLKKSSFCDII